MNSQLTFPFCVISPILTQNTEKKFCRLASELKLGIRVLNWIKNLDRPFSVTKLLILRVNIKKIVNSNIL